jgi:hypothetical protein
MVTNGSVKIQKEQKKWRKISPVSETNILEMVNE